MSIFIKKITPIYILTTLMIIIGLPMVIHGLAQEQMAKLGAVILLPWLGLAALLLVVDRFLASFVNYRVLIGAEIIVLLLLFAIYKYQNRVVQVSANSEITYFGIVNGVCDAAATELASTLGFNKSIVLNDDGQNIFLTERTHQQFKIDLSALKWGSYRISGTRETINGRDYMLEFYWPEKSNQEKMKAEAFESMKQRIISRTANC